MNETTTTSQAEHAAKNGEGTPAYTSFATLMSTLDRMKEQGGAPEQVDRSYLSKLPGGAQTIFLSSCKALGLIDENLVPTAALHELVAADQEKRKELIAQLLRRCYPGPLSLSERATQHQLEDEFRKYGLNGSTLRKSIGFFLNAAKFAEISVSQNFKLPKATPSTPRKRTTRNKNGGEGEQEPKPPAPPTIGLPTLVAGLIEKLPKDGEPWTEHEASQWLEIAKLTFPFVYNYKPSSPNGPEGDEP